MSNKYNAKRTYSKLCGRTFASKAECKQGEELRLLEMAREITGLEYQPKFTLSLKPKVSITLDFAYKPRLHSDPILQRAGEDAEKILLYGEEPYGGTVYEDVKGVLTRDFRTKLAWLKEKYGIDVRLIR